MADSGPTDEPSHRGRLVVADRVVEHIATIAAREVPGVAEVGSTVERIVGRRLPKADAHVAGQRARIRVDIAVTWPSPLATVTAGVRDTVRDRLNALAGVRVDSVDVTAAKVVRAVAPPSRRVQ